MLMFAYNCPSPIRGGTALLIPLAASLNLSSNLLSGLSLRSAAYLAFAPQTGLRHYLKMQYADQTFRGLYHWNIFDLALLLPYFAVMMVLAMYGIHRYTLYYLYFKNRKNYDPNPPKHFDELPRVTIQLPIFTE